MQPIDIRQELDPKTIATARGVFEDMSPDQREALIAVFRGTASAIAKSVSRNGELAEHHNEEIGISKAGAELNGGLLRQRDVSGVEVHAEARGEQLGELSAATAISEVIMPFLANKVVGLRIRKWPLDA